jgi:hypothetical protein
MAACDFVEIADKQISEIKINSVPKNPQKTCIKILKQSFASGSVIIGEYSPPLRLGECSPIILTSPSRRIIVKYWHYYVSSIPDDD